jgi:superfamily I DNA/RNA helicase
MTFTPTQEQLDIVEAARSTTDNLLINALAGAAKTSTLVLIAEAIKGTPMLCLAFNKKIATEMEDRLPGNCTSMTLNSLGHRAWAAAIGKRLVLNAKKTYEILSYYTNKLEAENKSAVFDQFSDIMRAIDAGKMCGWIPDGHFPNAKRLMTDDEFYASLDEEPSSLVWYLILKTTLESLSQAMKGTIDFNDQILMPTLFPCTFPMYPLVLVDEAQDLSALNHAMLRKLAKKRLIAVGDECQGIYGFRGAHADSMELLESTFQMKKFFLTTSFRCPTKVVEAARWRAPAMRWPEWAIEGSVTTLPQWSAVTIPDDAAIICRNNSPLFRTALRLLKAGRYPQVIGNDIGKSLLKILKKFGPSEMTQDVVLSEIALWKEAKLRKTRSPGSINDQAECLEVFAQAGKCLGDAIAYAEHIFNSSGPIKLMTGHKSKGLEFSHVFILDLHLVRVDERQQEQNLKYVMQTRAKESLTYIDTTGFQG